MINIVLDVKDIIFSVITVVAFTIFVLHLHEGGCESQLRGRKEIIILALALMMFLKTLTCFESIIIFMLTFLADKLYDYLHLKSIILRNQRIKSIKHDKMED